MIRVLGVAAIFSAAAAAFFQCERKRGSELETIEELLLALHTMESQIRYERTALIPLFRQLSRSLKGDAAGFFERLYAFASKESELPLSDHWENAAGELPVPDDAMKLWKGLGRRLIGDEESVRNSLQMAAERMKDICEKLNAGRPEKRKLTGVICGSAAALLVILLI